MFLTEIQGADQTCQMPMNIAVGTGKLVDKIATVVVVQMV